MRPKTGNKIIGNKRHGIYLEGDGHNITENDIRKNGKNGITFGKGGRAVFLRNYISESEDLGIDLLYDGPTPNDSGDVDNGPNRLQNFPVLTSVKKTEIKGKLFTEFDGNYRIEFFVNSSCEANGRGEGEKYLGHVDYVSTAGTDSSFIADLPESMALNQGDVITATATYFNQTGNSLETTGTSEFSKCKEVSVSTGIEEENKYPSEYKLSPPYPNPFNPTTQFNLNLVNGQQVKIEVFNILGEKVAEIYNGFLTKGNHTFVFDAKNLTSGEYIYRAAGSNFIKFGKMLLMK